ncbi:MAG: C-terminal helicase domain-containing protein, partial [Planctomycetales bacterium]|nr:C-terminal helicase domain-containing protein [Planctomycetales bacterium]
FRVLVATDVIGRGIDVSGISHIINYDIPTFSDDYVHRVGRTGRMGREGVAYTFVTPEEGMELTRIEQRINQQLKRDEIKGFDPISMPERPKQVVDETPPPQPPPSGRTRARRHRRAL